MLTHAARLLSVLARRRDGSVALLFAAALVVLCLSIGMAIDYANAARYRSKLQGAADEAALAASRAAAAYLTSNGWSTANATAAAAAGVTAGKAAFAANMDSTGLDQPATVTPVMTIPSAQSITANVTAAANVPTSLMQLAGFDSLAIGSTASAVASLPVSYYQFIFLVDISGSMAIGGTSSDIAKLQASSYYGNCGFACHDPNNYGYPDYRVRAANNGIKLKIDYVNSAIQTFLTTLDTALTKASADSRTSIYTYATTFNTLQSVTSSLSTAISKAATIDIEPVGKASTNWGYTKTASALTSLKSQISGIGDGTTSAGRKTYVVFISDGLEDLSAAGTTYGRSTDVAYTSGCTAIKNLNSNLTLITIEPTYPVVPNDAQYTQIVAPYASQLGPTMKSCASSSSWSFSADDGPGIVSAMNNAVAQITSSLRISR